MNNSTEGVTLYSGFITDLLRSYENLFAMRSLFEMCEHLDLSNPTSPVPMQLYNDMCDHIESKLGPVSIRRAGVEIGKRAYLQMVETKLISSNPTPQEILQGLKVIADTMVQDTNGRGWTIIEKENNRMVMRRTQTFNASLQEGIIASLVKQSSHANSVNIKYLRSVKNGDEYDDYEITWSKDVL